MRGGGGGHCGISDLCRLVGESSAQSWIFLVKFPKKIRELKRRRFFKNPDYRRTRVGTGNLKIGF